MGIDFGKTFANANNMLKNKGIDIFRTSMLNIFLGLYQSYYAFLEVEYLRMQTLV